MKRVILVHGWQSDPERGWKAWLRHELEKKKVEVIAPQFPGGAHPRLEEWLATLREAVGTPDKKTFFIGHSLGCITICHYLAQLPVHIRVGGCVFVAGGVGPSIHPELAEFYAPALNFTNVRHRARVCKVIAARDDTSFSFKRALETQRLLQAELIIDDGNGHFSQDDGVTELPSALNALLGMMRHEK